MPFNSFLFIVVFLPLAVLGRRVMSRFGARHSQVFLLVASLGFYAWSKASFLFFLAGSILFNLLAAQTIAHSAGAARRRWLILGLCGNVIFLGTLKYTQFFASILTGITGYSLPLPQLWFPLGVSFFTIQQIMYLVDCYEGLSTAHGFLDHASFIACFPYLTSGPLTRARTIVPQLQKAHAATSEDISRGLFLFGIGLFKKVVIADCIVRIADTGFSNVRTLSAAEAWIACGTYCLQIYFDFSGYSDMALGVGRMLGLRIPENFRSPYRSTSIIDFWQRWHITLSQFITTYLYTPMVRGVRRVTLRRASVATIAAMAIAGLWHGPSSTYIVFGLVHGLALVINQLWRKKVKRHLPIALSWVLTMGVVLIAFVFFRSPTLGAAGGMFRALFCNPHLIGFDSLRSVIRRTDLMILGLPTALALPLALLGPDSNELAQRMIPSRRGMLVTIAAFLCAFLFLNSTLAQDFVYFAF